MNQAQLTELKAKGKIRGFTKPAKKYSAKGKNNIPVKKSKALIWIEQNLQEWAIENGAGVSYEYRFHMVRKWRFDFAVFKQPHKIAVEFEGGIFLKKSGHNTAIHYTKDVEKYNAATLLDWKVLRYTALNYKNVIRDLNEVIKIVNA